MSQVDQAAEHCPVCAEASDDLRLYTVRGFPIVRCRRCGVGRTLVAANFDPRSLYDETYFQGGRHDGYADYQGSARVLRGEFRAAFRQLGRAGIQSGRLLEVGCAYGYFLDEAARAFRVSGVEVAESAASACRSRGHDVASGVATEAFLSARGPFDALVMLDVIEHLQRPDEVLALLARHAKPGAALLLSTGDWGSLTSRVMGRRWRLMTPPQHLWFFTQASLAKLLAQAGFRVTAVQHPWKQVPLGLMAYQLGRALGLQALVRRLPVPTLGLPVNLFDAVRVVARFTG
ncbi:MAG: class I SAM-dependent methyltransferase [Planctomycetes bacterium]|nr:class I SAM-dependent methyltransferase [Planctomycetota bacterium]